MKHRAAKHHTESANNRPNELGGTMLQRFWMAVQAANNYSSLITAFATVFIAGLTVVLAITGNWQADIAQKALEINARPHIDMNFVGGTIVVNPGAKMNMRVEMKNFGGSPTVVNTRGVVMYSPTKLRAPSIDGVPRDLQTIFPKAESPTTAFIYSVDPITEGQIKDMKSGIGYIYMRISATYGLHRREICNELPLRQTTVPDHNFTANILDITHCEEPASNDAD